MQPTFGPPRRFIPVSTRRKLGYMMDVQYKECDDVNVNFIIIDKRKENLMLTIELIRSWPVDADGWHVSPEGKHVKLGYYCTLGDDCTLGYRCKLGNDCKLGYRCTLGDRCTLGYRCVLTHTPIYIIGTKYFVAYVSGDLVQSGCITKPISWWLENVERCAQEHSYTPTQQKEYRMHVEHVAAWMRLYGYLDTKGEHDEH